MIVAEVKKHYWEWKCPNCGLIARQNIESEDEHNDPKLKLVCWNCKKVINQGEEWQK